jgi:membrane-associated protease RseP (regulator of RpoE activity)
MHASNETLNYSTTNNSHATTVNHQTNPAEYLYSTVKLADSNAILPTQAHDLPSLNAYPEIKLCEFFGYPTGTQLGLVVTSDEYSHDVVKVADDSPAYKAGIMKGDVILAVNDQHVEGSAKSIEQLNDFSETRPLKVLVASRYAYEWSKLLQKKITEKDWPNIRRIHTKFVGIPSKSLANHPVTSSFYSQPSNTKIYYDSYDTKPKGVYYEDQYETTAQEIEIPTYNQNLNYAPSVHQKRIQNQANEHAHTNLCRSAVDITADGKVNNSTSFLFSAL